MRWLCLALFPLGQGLTCLATEGCSSYRGRSLLQTTQKRLRDGKVHVAYATTMNSTGPGDAGLMASLLSMSRALGELKSIIHLIVPSEDVQSAADFVSCFKNQFHSSESYPNVEIHSEIPMTFDPGRNEHTKWLSGNTMTYARWYLPQYLPEVSRVLYIDTDTIVRRSISALFKQDPEVAIMLKPCGWICQGQSLETHYPADSNVIPEAVRNARVMSAGVMMANLDLWRTMNVTDKLVAMAETHLAQNATLDDQLILNIIAQQSNSFQVLDERYNTEGPGYVQNCHVGFPNETVIIHWSGPNKFWNWIGKEPRGSCFADDYLPTEQCATSNL